MSAIIDSSDDAIIAKTPDGTITSWNRGAQNIYGYRETEIVGRSIALLVPPELPDDTPSILAKIRDGQRVEHYETIRVRKDGRRLHMSLTISPIRDETGRVIGASTIGRDITEQRLAQEILRESEGHYRSLFQKSNAVMLILDPETAAIIDANPAACAYYGYSPAEITTLKITDINTLSPEQIFQEMAQARSEQRNQFFFEHRLANGEVRPVEVFSGPIELDGRRLLYSMVHDISARRQAEEAVHLSEQRLRHILEDFPLATIYTDGQDRIEFTNRTFTGLFGYTQDEIPSLEDLFRHLFPDQTYRTAALSHWNADATRAKALNTKIGPAELRVTSKDRSVHTCEITGTFLEKGVLLIFNDISERIQAEEAIKRSEERIRIQFKSIPIPTLVWVMGRHGLVLMDYNDAAFYFTKGMIAGMVGMSSDRIFEDMFIAREGLDACMTKSATVENEFWFELKGIKKKYVSVKYAFVPPDQILMHLNDITLQKLADEHLHYISIHDSLTDLYNRFYADAEVERLVTSRMYPASAIMIDLDGLKTINDHDGHAAGDKYIKEAAGILRQTFRPEDLIARIGGDEFLVLLPYVDEITCAQSAARLRTNMEIFNAGHPDRPVLFSVGTATAYAGGELKDCLKQADAHMYQEKATKKNSARP